MCDRWRFSFKKFIDDMGIKPGPDHSIDRIDNDKGYEPGNCRWATELEQGRNKRNVIKVELNGKIQRLRDLAELHGVSGKLLSDRLRRGFSGNTLFDETFLLPPTKSKTLKVGGEHLTYRQIKSVATVSPSTVRRRIARLGWDHEKAVSASDGRFRGETYESNGLSMTIAEWSSKTGIPQRVIRNRIKILGWSIEDSVMTVTNNRKRG